MDISCNVRNSNQFLGKKTQLMRLLRDFAEVQAPEIFKTQLVKALNNVI